MTGTGVAMSVVDRGRALGLSDAEIIERWPVSLALTAPRILAPPSLPPVVALAEDGSSSPAGSALPRVGDLPTREALRLRARWLQELSERRLVIDVRAYHDAGMLEVGAFQSQSRIQARYSYPNKQMFQQDEKLQQNEFLGDWLAHCQANGLGQLPASTPGNVR